MEKLTQEQYSKLGFYSSRAGSELIQLLHTLGVGEAVRMTAEDWKYKSHPSSIISAVFKRSGSGSKFSTRRLAEGGFAIQRTE